MVAACGQLRQVVVDENAILGVKEFARLGSPTMRESATRSSQASLRAMVTLARSCAFCGPDGRLVDRIAPFVDQRYAVFAQNRADGRPVFGDQLFDRLVFHSLSP